MSLKVNRIAITTEDIVHHQSQSDSSNIQREIGVLDCMSGFHDRLSKQLESAGNSMDKRLNQHTTELSDIATTQHDQQLQLANLSDRFSGAEQLVLNLHKSHETSNQLMQHMLVALQR